MADKNNGKFIVCCFHDIIGLDTSIDWMKNSYLKSRIYEMNIEYTLPEELNEDEVSSIKKWVDLTINEDDDAEYLLIPIDVRLIDLLLKDGYKVVLIIPTAKDYVEYHNSFFGVKDHFKPLRYKYMTFVEAMLDDFFLLRIPQHKNLYTSNGVGTFLREVDNKYFDHLRVAFGWEKKDIQ